ncbi:MAG: hypothetical protein EOP84_11770 [Verrucomicrobiaceae bacterium]|nr:MAG: hypothetical protein EOP84_11770 [Verrucomicrobiaceae bacterium]
MNLKTTHASAGTLNRRRFHLHLGRVLILLLSVGFLGSKVAAEDTPEAEVTRTPMVEMEAQFVRATAEQMRVGLRQAGIQDDVLVFNPVQAEKALEALKKTGAVFFSNPRTLTRSGRQATVEAIRELRYPTEYEPSKTELGKYLPTSFETRNVGVTVEFKPHVTTEGFLEIDLVPQVVKFRGFVDYSNLKPATDPNDANEIERLLKAPLRDGGLWHPIFTLNKVTTSVSIHSGHTVLIKFLETAEAQAAAPGQAKADELSNYVFITARILTAQ